MAPETYRRWIADATLIVAAVNALPLHLEAVRALSRMVETGQDITPESGLPDPGSRDWSRFSEAWHEARRILKEIEARDV